MDAGETGDDRLAPFGLERENFEPSTIRAMISVASNGMRSSAETMPYNSSAAYAGGSVSVMSIQSRGASTRRWLVVAQISRSFP